MKEILSINDEKLLINFEKFLKDLIQKSGKEITPMTTEKLNKRIDMSEKDFFDGDIRMLACIMTKHPLVKIQIIKKYCIYLYNYIFFEK